LTVLDSVMFARPGAFHTATLEGRGVWGSPSESSAELGEEFLNWCRQAVVDVVHDIDAVHDRLDAGSD
jgi:creatinine amidohydrolase/Fe(II)-dependent formamide hydrolase-like protein